MLTAEQRSSLHALAARWLAEHPDAAPEEVANHFAEAGLDGEARDYWLQAAMAADRLGDSRNVIAYGDRALAAGEPLAPATEHALRSRRVLAMAWRGDREAERGEYEAIATVENAANTTFADTMVVRLRNGRMEMVEGNHDIALQLLDQATQLAEEAGDALMTSRGHAHRVFCLIRLGRFDDAAEAVRLATEAATRTEDPIASAHAAQARSFLASTQGRNAEALAGYRDCARYYEDGGDPRNAAVSGANLASAMQQLGDHDGARQVCELALRRIRLLGLRMPEGYALQVLGITTANTLDPEEGVALETQALAIGREINDQRLAAAALTNRAFIALTLLQRPDDAEADIDAGLEAASHTGPALQLPLRALRTMLRVAQERYHEALAELDTARELHAQVGGRFTYQLEMLVAVYDALMALGRAEDAAKVAGEAVTTLNEAIQGIDDNSLRRKFVENVPAHVRVQQLAAELG